MPQQAMPQQEGHTDLTAEQWRALLAGPAEPLARELSRAASAGDRVAQVHYGQCLLDGHGVAADPAAAFVWFHRAAQGGEVAAINMVGRCLDQGWGVRASPEQAAPWFERAAQAGDAWGLYNFATALALGRGVAPDRPRALDLFRRAAAMGHAKSMTMVGSFHEDGWGVPVNRAIAAYHYARGAEAGDFRGAFNHARMLAEAGEQAAAVHWLGRARAGAQAVGNARFVDQLDRWVASREGFTPYPATANDSQ